MLRYACTTPGGIQTAAGFDCTQHHDRAPTPRRTAGPDVPQEQLEVRRANKSEAVGLIHMLVWPAGYPWQGLGNVRHHRPPFLHQLVLPEQLDQPAARVIENLQRPHEHAIDLTVDIRLHRLGHDLLPSLKHQPTRSAESTDPLSIYPANPIKLEMVLIPDS